MLCMENCACGADAVQPRVLTRSGKCFSVVVSNSWYTSEFGFSEGGTSSVFSTIAACCCSRRVDAAFRSNEPTCAVPRDRYRKTTEISFSLYHLRHRTHISSMSVVYNVFASLCVRRVFVVILFNSKPVSCHPLFPNRLPQEGGTSSVFSTVVACLMFAPCGRRLSFERAHLRCASR